MCEGVQVFQGAHPLKISFNLSKLEVCCVFSLLHCQVSAANQCDSNTHNPCLCACPAPCPFPNCFCPYPSPPPTSVRFDVCVCPSGAHLMRCLPCITNQLNRLSCIQLMPIVVVPMLLLLLLRIVRSVVSSQTGSLGPFC